MMAFVGSFASSTLTRPSAFSGAKVCNVNSAVAARVSMSGKSPSMPFMDAPEALSPELPGYAGFGK